jgi:hypothetical protein
MAYIGQTPFAYNIIKLDSLTFDGVTATFNIFSSGVAFAPGNAASLLISLAGVLQNPYTDFTVAGSSITFTTIPAIATPFFGVSLGKALDIGTVADGAITNLKISGPISVANGGTGASTTGSAPFALKGSNTDITGLSSGSAFPILVGGIARVTVETDGRVTIPYSVVPTNVIEKSPATATAATGTINLDAKTNSILNCTANAAANWIVNIRGDAGVSMNTMLGIGETTTITFLVPQGATAYYNTSVQVDGTATGVTTKWLGGVPTSGDVSSINVYSYSVLKTAASTYTILASKAVYS